MRIKRNYKPKAKPKAPINLYYIRFEAEYNNWEGTQSTSMIEEFVYAKDIAHAEIILSKWYKFANDYDEAISNLETTHLLRSNVPRRKHGGIVIRSFRQYLLDDMAKP